LAYLQQKGIEPEEVNTMLFSLESAPISERAKAANLLKRPNVELEHLMQSSESLNLFLSKYLPDSLEQAVISLKYASYIDKENQMASKMEELENYRIKDRLDYKSITALSNEAREKLFKVQPETLGQASRISGVSPADISILMVYLGK
jgi:tRNA uridine 5-carboxymethylaminomethyl modification enzyme